MLEHIRWVWWRLLWWLGFAPRPQLLAEVTPLNPSPDAVTPGRLIVVGGKDFQKWAYFRCPCGCGETIMLSLSSARRPRWSVIIDQLGRPTIRPSVRQVSGCFSHFFVRQGVVDWCGDTGRAWTATVGYSQEE